MQSKCLYSVKLISFLSDLFGMIQNRVKSYPSKCENDFYLLGINAFRYYQTGLRLLKQSNVLPIVWPIKINFGQFD